MPIQTKNAHNQHDNNYLVFISDKLKKDSDSEDSSIESEDSEQQPQFDLGFSRKGGLGFILEDRSGGEPLKSKKMVSID